MKKFVQGPAALALLCTQMLSMTLGCTLARGTEMTEGAAVAPRAPMLITKLNHATATPTTGTSQWDLSYYQPFYCTRDAISCLYGAIALITPNAHIPSMVSGLGFQIVLDGVVSTYTAGYTPNYNWWSASYYLGWAPCSPTSYLWPGPPLSGQSACYGKDNTIAGVWSYPTSGPGPVTYEVDADSTPLVVVPFTLDPAVLKKINGDGMTIPANSDTGKRIIVEVDNPDNTPVDFGMLGKVVPVTATLATPSGKPTPIPNTAITYLGNAQFTIEIAVGAKGTYVVTVKHRDADPNSPTIFTINVNDKDPAPNNPTVEQGNGTNNDGTDQTSLTNHAAQTNGSSNPCDPAFTADPINVTNGNHVRLQADYAQTGLSPLEFTRAYNSQGSNSFLMGNYWTTTYDRFVIPASGSQPVRLRRPDGQTIRFTPSGNGFVADPFFHGAFMKSGTGWRYIDTNQTIEDFDSTGKLSTITDLHGRMQSLTYSKGLLTKVSANTGESLIFAYTNSQVTTVTDQAKRVWTYAYDGYLNLTSVKSPDGIVQTYHYLDIHNPYLLTGSTIGSSIATTDQGKFVAWEYDSQGRATANYFTDTYSTTGQHKRYDVAYNSDGMTTVMDGNGNNSLYNTQSVNGRGFVSATAGPGFSSCGNDLEQTFDASMNVTSLTQFGHTTTFNSYDAKGQAGNRVDAVGTAEQRKTDYLYDPRYFGKPTLITEPSVVRDYSKTTSLQYDAYGNVAQKVESGFRPNVDPMLPPTPISRTWTYLYNGLYHQLSQIDGPRTDVADIVKFAYNTAGRLTSATDANNIVQRSNILYTVTGNILSEDRANGLHISYTYYAGSDLLQTVTQTQGYATQTTIWTYDLFRRVASITFGDGANVDQSVSFNYNNSGELQDVTSASGAIHFSFDDQGNRIRDSYRDGSATEQRFVQRTFDAYNRLSKVIGANNTIERDYYPDGTLTQTKDGKQQQTQRRYDGLKRLTKVIRPDASQIQYGYDAAGNLDQVIDPNSATTNYVYDDFGNKITQISPDTGTTQYSYDLAGNLIQTTDALGQVAKYTYDTGNRLLTVDRVGTAYDEIYAYDTCTNGTGFICSITTGAGDAVAYAYNGFGHIASVATFSNSVAYQYDALNHITQITYPSGRTVSYAYNGGGQVIQVAVNENGNVTNLASNVMHKPFGPLTSWTYGNGLVHTRQYDKQFWAGSISTPTASTLAYPQYDLNGNLLTMQIETAVEQFTYDTVDELKSASGDFGSRSYNYDAVGNRIGLTANGANSSYTYTPLSNRIAGQTGWTYMLDANGNTRQKLATDGSGGGQSYTYSPHNRLTAVYDLLAPAVPKATYRYNALGQRVAKITGATETHYVYGLDGKLLAETDGAGHVLQEYVYLDGSPLALLDAPTPRAPAGSYEVSVEASQFSGSWTVKSDTSAVGGSYYYLSKPAAATYAIWNFTTPGAGYYDVYVWWEGGGGTVTKYEVNNTPITLTNAAQTKGTWSKLGNFHLVGGPNTVRILGSDNTEKNDYIAADAVRMVQTISDSPPNPNYKYVHTDHLGAPRSITNASGAVIWRATYDPFGLVTANDDVANTGQHTTLNLRFPGQYYDQESGLHYNYFRDYDPSIGRYIESDPIGLGGGLNAFGYAGADPISGVDVLGLAVGEPGVAESFVPIWGSGREAINDFQEGNYGWGTANTALAISDVLLVNTAGKAICKGIWKGGSHAWRATRSWYGATRDLAPGTPVHHWLIEQKSEFGKLVPDWLKNQPWNLLPMESREFHNAVHGWGPNAFNAVEAAWYGTPNWAMLLWSDEMGKGANAAANH